MATAVAAPRLRVRQREAARSARRGWPVENLVLYALALAFYLAVASYLVFHMHYMIGDAYARIDNAFDVLFTADPHLAGIGFFWPPLPSFMELPIIAFRPLWPALVTQGFGGSIEAAAFSAGTVVLFNSGLRWAHVSRLPRWLLCLVWAVNPMTVIYAAQGMSEAMFVFFFVATILVFLRWSESRRSALLPLLGVCAGLGCLCRNEAFVLAALVGVGVIVQCLRDRASWREVEVEALLYGLPALLVVMLWIGSMAVILHDPFYWLHANGFGGAPVVAAQGPPVAQPTPEAVANAYGLIHFDTLRGAANFIITHSVALFPGVVVLLALVAARLVIQPRRVAGVLLVLFGCGIPALDILLIQRGMGPYIRYQIAVIPFAFVMVVYLLRSVRNRPLTAVAATAMAAAMALSTALTAQTLSNPDLAPQEAPLVAALQAGQRVPASAGLSPMDLGADVASHILAFDRDGGRILCDSTTCFPIILNVPDVPRLFVVTSDKIFEAAAAQPQVYGVEYFLAPAPVGQGALDRLNVLYPYLWNSGGGFSRLVGSYAGFRLYRLTGPTGRG